MTQSVTINLAANDEALKAGLARADQSLRSWGGKAQQAAEVVGKRMSTSVAGIGGHLTGFMSGQLGLIGGGLTLGAMASAAGENAAAQRKLDAVLRATGNSTGMARYEMDELAKSLSKTTGNSVATNKEAMALLATFTSIRGDQFKGTLTAAEDMAAVFGTDVSNAVRMVGKAVNDPLEGVNRLKEVGISFTDEQQKQIKNYFAMGQAAKSQQVILDELNKRMGGASKNTASPTTRALNEIKEAGATMGEAALPAISEVTQWAAAGVTKYFEASAWFGRQIYKATYGKTDADIQKTEEALKKYKDLTAKLQARAAILADLSRQRSELDFALPKSFTQQLAADLEPLENIRLKLQAIEAEAAKLGKQNPMGWSEDRSRRINSAMDKVFESRESGLGIGNGVDSQIRRYREQVSQYYEMLTDEASTSRQGRSAEQIDDELKMMERAFAGDLRSKAEQFSKAWADINKKLSETGQPADAAKRALDGLVEQTIGADPDKFTKYGEELDNLNAIMDKSGMSAEEQARRRKALNESMFGPAVLTNLQRYRKELEDISRAEKAGLGGSEAAARRKASGESLTGADIFTAAEKYRKANEAIDARARTDPNYFSSGQLMRQTTAARKQYNQDSGLQSVLDSIKEPEQQLSEQLKRLADMRLGREGFIPGSLSTDQYHAAVNKAVEGSQGGSFRASFVGGQDLWRNMAQNGMSQGGGQVFEEARKTNGYMVKLVDGIAELVEATRGSKKRGVLSD